jgi:hypothetical protein
MKSETNIKTMLLAGLAVGMIAVFSTSAAHADGIALGTPAYAGTGCPAGTVAASLSTDQSQLSILFDQFSAEAGGSSGRTIDRKSCNLAIPVHVPQGLSVSLIKVDYRGFNAIPSGGRSQFNVEYFFAGSRGPSFTRVFTGPQANNYELTNNLIAQAAVWSPCGQDVILRTNANILAVTNAQREQTMSTVDSADITAGILYQIQWRTCFR